MEGLGVGGQPAVRAGRPEVELGAQPVQRLARRCDPAGVWVAGVEHGLLGVGPERGVDDQRDTVGAGRGLHAVEGAGHVGAHRLALAQLQRPAVLADATRVGARQRAGRDELGLGDSVVIERRPAVCAPSPALARVADRHAHADGSQAGAGELDVRSALAVAPRGLDGDATPERQVLVALEVRRVRSAVDERRLEHTRVDVAHRPRARERSQIGRSLALAGHAEPARNPAQDERADEHAHERAEHDQQCGAALAACAGGDGWWHGNEPAGARVTGLPRDRGSVAEEVCRLCVAGPRRRAGLRPRRAPGPGSPRPSGGCRPRSSASCTRRSASPALRPTASRSSSTCPRAARRARPRPSR